MRRKEPVKKEKKRYRSFSWWHLFFWKTCDICGYQYRRELMHIILIGYDRKTNNIKTFDGYGYNSSIPLLPPEEIVNPGSMDGYRYCSHCCKTQDDARTHFEKNELPRYFPRG